MKHIFTPDFMYSNWASGKKFKLEKKTYTMHKMSYGDYFAEPSNWRGGENDGFASGTLWFRKQNLYGRSFYEIVD